MNYNEVYESLKENIDFQKLEEGWDVVKRAGVYGAIMLSAGTGLYGIGQLAEEQPEYEISETKDAIVAEKTSIEDGALQKTIYSDFDKDGTFDKKRTTSRGSFAGGVQTEKVDITLDELLDS